MRADESEFSFMGEFQYRFEERLALLCPNGETPTREQNAAATREAWLIVEALKREANAWKH